MEEEARFIYNRDAREEKQRPTTDSRTLVRLPCLPMLHKTSALTSASAYVDTVVPRGPWLARHRLPQYHDLTHPSPP